MSNTPNLERTKENLLNRPNHILTQAYNDLDCTSGAMRIKLHFFVLSDIKDRRFELIRDDRNYSGVVVREGQAIDPSTHFALNKPWPEFLAENAATVPLVHLDPTKAIAGKWLAGMADRGMLGVESRCTVPVENYKEEQTLSDIERQAEIAALCQENNLFPIVGISVDRYGDHTAADCSDATTFALRHLQIACLTKGARPNEMGIQTSLVMHGKHNDANLVSTDVARYTRTVLNDTDCVAETVPLVCVNDEDAPTTICDDAASDLVHDTGRDGLTVNKLFAYSPEQMAQLSKGT